MYKTIKELGQCGEPQRPPQRRNPCQFLIPDLRSKHTHDHTYRNNLKKIYTSNYFLLLKELFFLARNGQTKSVELYRLMETHD